MAIRYDRFKDRFITNYTHACIVEGTMHEMGLSLVSLTTSFSFFISSEKAGSSPTFLNVALAWPTSRCIFNAMAIAIPSSYRSLPLLLLTVESLVMDSTINHAFVAETTPTHRNYAAGVSGPIPCTLRRAVVRARRKMRAEGGSKMDDANLPPNHRMMPNSIGQLLSLSFLPQEIAIRSWL